MQGCYNGNKTASEVLNFRSGNFVPSAFPFQTKGGQAVLEGKSAGNKIAGRGLPHETLST